jgi:hypothetical protein
VSGQGPDYVPCKGLTFVKVHAHVVLTDLRDQHAQLAAELNNVPADDVRFAEMQAHASALLSTIATLAWLYE